MKERQIIKYVDDSCLRLKHASKVILVSVYLGFLREMEEYSEDGWHRLSEWAFRAL